MSDFELGEIDKRISKIVRDILPEGKLISFLNNGSKRIRYLIAIKLIKLYGKTIDENIYNILIAGEVIHNASLLHDDVIDDSELRRGVTTIGKEFSQNISILCGDYLVSEAIELLLKINDNSIFNKFNKCVKEMALAEIKQYFLRNSIPALEEYLRICEGKTAGLFETILYSCAKYLELDTNLASNFGKLFGIAFQIKNDFETYSSNQDKKNKIYTVIDILGIENARTLLDNYKSELTELLQNFPNNENREALEGIIKGL